jgi:hypothetical protein
MLQSWFEQLLQVLGQPVRWSASPLAKQVRAHVLEPHSTVRSLQVSPPAHRMSQGPVGEHEITASLQGFWVAGVQSTLHE